MYCYNCGKEIAETVKFCPYCGAEQKQPQQSPQWQQPQQPVQQPQQQDTQWQAPQQPTQRQNPPAANNSGKTIPGSPDFPSFCQPSPLWS